MNIHLSFGEARNKALDQVFAAYKNNFVLVGDMNMDPIEFKRYLKKSQLSDLLIHQTKFNTRKGVKDDGKIYNTNLDYYISPKNILYRNVKVHENNDLSDHTMISAIITFS